MDEIKEDYKKVKNTIKEYKSPIMGKIISRTGAEDYKILDKTIKSRPHSDHKVIFISHEIFFKRLGS